MKRIWLLLLMVMTFAAGCRPTVETQTPVSSSATPTLAPTANPTMTPEPPETLAVCTARLPESLFPYAGFNSTSKANIFAILYEAPFEQVNGEASPGIVDPVPTQTNGGVRLAPVSVQRGQTVVDAEGNLAVFKPGLRVRPSGCRGTECVVAWDGETDLEMDRMVVAFDLREGLTWSDGQPVTAQDSVFSFRLANDPEAPGAHWAEDRTDSYRALDPQTVEWTGRPGFTIRDLSRLFWKPLPAHLFEGGEGWAELASAEPLAAFPLSYGAFQLAARTDDQIQFTPNPYDGLTGEGRPLADVLVFRQIEGGREGALQALESGECDLLDASFGWGNAPGLLSEINSEDRFGLQVAAGAAWWQLVFGIVPAAYDDGYQPAFGDRPDYFGDPQVRAAFAACLDREALAEAALGEWGQVWPSFLAPGESQISAGDGLIFDPQGGQTALQAAGWLDYDADPETARIAINVPNIPDGTVLQVEMLVDETPFQKAMAELIRKHLAICGISVDVQALPSGQLYAPGPEGPLFGRQFDLALIAWGSGPEPDCRLYQSKAVPSEGNQWVGTNIAGLSQTAYDLACASAGLAMADQHPGLMRQAELDFLDRLPAIPLFSPPEALIYSTAGNVAGLLTAGNGFLNMLEALMGD